MCRTHTYSVHQPVLFPINPGAFTTPFRDFKSRRNYDSYFSHFITGRPCHQCAPKTLFLVRMPTDPHDPLWRLSTVPSLELEAQQAAVQPPIPENTGRLL